MNQVSTGIDAPVDFARCREVVSLLTGSESQEGIELRPDPYRASGYIVRGAIGSLPHPGRLSLRSLRGRLPSHLTLRKVVAHKPDPHDSLLRFSLVLEDEQSGASFLADTVYLHPRRGVRPGHVYRVAMMTNRSEVAKAIRSITEEDSCQRQLKL